VAGLLALEPGVAPAEEPQGLSASELATIVAGPIKALSGRVLIDGAPATAAFPGAVGMPAISTSNQDANRAGVSQASVSIQMYLTLQAGLPGGGVDFEGPVSIRQDIQGP
jgi:hypothetical protein